MGIPHECVDIFVNHVGRGWPSRYRPGYLLIAGQDQDNGTAGTIDVEHFNYYSLNGLDPPPGGF